MTFIPPLRPRQTSGEFADLRRSRYVADADTDRHRREARQQRTQGRRGWLGRLLRPGR